MKKILLVIIVGSLVVAACQSVAPTEEIVDLLEAAENPEGESSQGLGGDQGGQAEGEAQPQAPTATTGLDAQTPQICLNRYFPVAEGYEWTYDLTTAAGTVSHTETITDVGSDAFLVITEHPNLSYVVTWACTTEGLNWLQSNGGMFSAIFESGGTVETLSHSGVFLPANINPGDKWKTTELITVSGPYEGTFNIHADFHAIGMEVITVPAGTFNALRVDAVISNDLGTTIQSSFWFAQNVGMVRNYGVTNETITSELVLNSVSFPIP